MSVKRYWSYAGGDASMQETETGNYVKYEDYASLERKNIELAVQLANAESKCREMAAEVQAVRWACGQVYVKGYNHGHLNTVDRLPYADEKDLVMRGGEVLCEFTDPDHCGVAADAILAEVRAHGVTEYASKRGFSFQHGSIHAHFGNGDVMVGSVTFENGDAGINFAPVREKTGGVGTHYDWTKGKTAEQVDSVFVIASSNTEGLEVIRDKLSEAIAQLRKGAAL